MPMKAITLVEMLTAPSQRYLEDVQALKSYFFLLLGYNIQKYLRNIKRMWKNNHTEVVSKATKLRPGIAVI